MKDEIKEFNEEKYVEMLEDGTLYDYITNLQEENERLTQGTTVLTNKIIDMTKENERLKEKLEDETLNKEIAQGHRKQVQDIELQERKELKDYKSRNEKAIEYLANCDWNCKDFEKLYDILGGDDNE